MPTLVTTSRTTRFLLSVQEGACSTICAARCYQLLAQASRLSHKKQSAQQLFFLVGWLDKTLPPNQPNLLNFTLNQSLSLSLTSTLLRTLIYSLTARAKEPENAHCGLFFVELIQARSSARLWQSLWLPRHKQAKQSTTQQRFLRQ